MDKNDFVSTIAVDYTTLLDLLKAENFEDANKETMTLCLKAAGQEKIGWLNAEHASKIPSEDLHLMNQLWQDYSNRHFGFSVQSLIWQSKTWRTACKELGWSRGYSHRSNRGYFYSTFSDESQLTFNVLEAPAGHLPSTAIHIALQERTRQPFMDTLLRRFHVSHV